MGIIIQIQQQHLITLVHYMLKYVNLKMPKLVMINHSEYSCEFLVRFTNGRQQHTTTCLYWM